MEAAKSMIPKPRNTMAGRARSQQIDRHIEQLNPTPRLARRWGIATTLAAGALSIAMFPTLSNAASVGLVVVSTLITFFYCLDARPLYEAPLSTLAVLSLNLTTQSGALIIQTLSFRPIDFNLLIPELTFGCLLGAQLATIAGHHAYRKVALLRGVSAELGARLWTPLQLFYVPSNAQLWVMGIIGLAAVIFTRVLYAGDIDLGNVGGKFFQGFEFLTYAPFLIPLLDFFVPPNGRPRRVNWLLISGFFLALLVVGMARNARITFALAIATIGICWIFAALMGRIKLAHGFFRKALLTVLVSAFGIAFLTDLATAMVVVRSAREEVSYVNLVEMTVVAMTDRTALADRQRLEAGESGYGMYSEYYTVNPMLRRIITTKFHDNMLESVWKFSSEDRVLVMEATRDRFFSLLPMPVISLFGLRVPKDEIGYSMGDRLYSLGTGQSMTNYFIVGSYLAHGIAMFGWLFFPVLAIGVCGICVVLESFASRIRGFPEVSTYALLIIYGISQFFAGDDLGNQMAYLGRIMWQQILIYLLALTVARLLTPSASNGSLEGNAVPQGNRFNAIGRLRAPRGDSVP